MRLLCQGDVLPCTPPSNIETQMTHTMIVVHQHPPAESPDSASTRAALAEPLAFHRLGLQLYVYLVGAC
eukprot:3061202-Amphidinium_carterae.1